MKKQQFVVDVANHIYTLDGKDISPHLVGLNIRMRGYEKIVELSYDTHNIVLKGILATDELEIAPTVCKCGYEIAPYRFKLDCICPKCGKHIRVTAGQIFFD